MRASARGAWLSAHGEDCAFRSAVDGSLAHFASLVDLRLQPPAATVEAVTTSPPSPSCTRRRTASFGSSSSISTSYQDITSGLLARVLTEVRAAAVMKTQLG